jgi:hypothetical protein
MLFVGLENKSSSEVKSRRASLLHIAQLLCITYPAVIYSCRKKWGTISSHVQEQNSDFQSLRRSGLMVSSLYFHVNRN